jgi:hypothetical protein
MMSRLVRPVRFAVLSGCLTALAHAPGGADDLLAFRDRGNRLEGHRRIEVSAPEFEALSFVRGSPLKSRPATSVLELGFFLPQAARVHITARELVAVTHYQMQAKQTDWKPGWNVFGPWETSAVIEPLGVQLANIGALARLHADRPGSGELAALSFGRGGSATEWSRYEFQFSVKYDLRTVSYTVERDDSGEVVRTGVLDDIGGGAPVSIRFDLANARDGRHRLIVDCLYRGRPGGPQRTFVFHHKT